MRKRALGLALASVLALSAGLATPAQAEMIYGRGDPSGYLAAAGLVAYDDRDDLKFWNYQNRNFGATVRAGFRLGVPFAVEIQGDYNNLRSWRKNDAWMITANFRGYPLQYFMDDTSLDFVQPYVVGGVGVLGGDPKGDKYQLNGSFRTGLGLDVYVTEQVALSAGYEWVTGTGYWSNIDSRNFLLGFQVNFGSGE